MGSLERDVLEGGDGDDYLVGDRDGRGYDEQDVLFGNGGDDELIGGGAPWSGNAPDKLIGGPGEDILSGSKMGYDFYAWLRQGDQLYGGADDDIYRFSDFDYLYDQSSRRETSNYDDFGVRIRADYEPWRGIGFRIVFQSGEY